MQVHAIEHLSEAFLEISQLLGDTFVSSNPGLNVVDGRDHKMLVPFKRFEFGQCDVCIVGCAQEYNFLVLRASGAIL